MNQFRGNDMKKVGNRKEQESKMNQGREKMELKERKGFFFKTQDDEIDENEIKITRNQGKNRHGSGDRIEDNSKRFNNQTFLSLTGKVGHKSLDRFSGKSIDQRGSSLRRNSEYGDGLESYYKDEEVDQKRDYYEQMEKPRYARGYERRGDSVRMNKDQGNFNDFRRPCRSQDKHDETFRGHFAMRNQSSNNPGYYSGGKPQHGNGRQDMGKICSRESTREKRDWLIGCKFLEKLLLLEPSETLLSLVNQTDRLDAFLNQDTMTDGNVSLLLKVMVKCKEVKLLVENKFRIYTLILQSKFFTLHLLSYFSGMLLGNSYRKKQSLPETLESLVAIFNELLNIFPSLAVEKLSSCIVQCLAVVAELSESGDLDVDDEILSQLREADAKRKQTIKNRKGLSKVELQQLETPPDDFRSLSIVPEMSDLLTFGKPFIRGNLTMGRYFDLQHYLDVQFRLLREDFLQPLREGLQQYLGSIDCGNRIKWDNIRIYTGVKIQGRKFTKNGLSYVVSLHKVNFEWDVSKRLIHGSLVCLSDDHFKSVIFATVTSRNEEGRIQVRFEGTYALKKTLFTSTYVMIESQAFFEAYSHVLRGLQGFRDDNMPMQRYIVSAEKDVNPPEYLDDNVQYDFECLSSADKRKDIQTFIDEEFNISNSCVILNVYRNVQSTGVSLVRFRGEEENIQPVEGDILCLSNDQFRSKFYATVSSVYAEGCLRVNWKASQLNSTQNCIMLACSSVKDEDKNNEKEFSDIVNLISENEKKISFSEPSANYYLVSPLDECSWPNKEALGLDESQYTALITALTKELCVIQGPPGTGKTFIGLNVVRVLLKNKETRGNSPILVVCYTNHALDQFLEGMLPYTTKLIRVGGRSCNSLAEYNLNRIRQNREKIRQTSEFYKTQNELLYYLRLEAWELQESIKLSYMGIISDDLLVSVLNSNMLENLLDYFYDYWERPPPSKLAAWLKLSFKDYHLRIVPGFFEEDKENTDDLLGQVGDDQINATDSKTQDGLVEIDNEVTIENERRMVYDDDNIEFDISDEEIKFKKLTEKVLALEVGKLTKYFHREIGESESIIRAKEQNQGLERKLKEKESRCENILRKELAEKSTISDDKFIGLNPWQLPIDARWKLYRSWRRKFVREYQDRLIRLAAAYEKEAKVYEEVRKEEELKILRGAEIVGMTTTGAAKHRDILQSLGAKIVIVEEAAEVLEAHLVTTLTKETQHIILIGDHQQLRPKATVYNLAKNYNLEISFFERMIKNGFPFVTLQEQHRMRPEIASLLVPRIYKELKNHESVLKYEPVLGMKTNMFFINHNEREDEIDETKSHANEFEAEFLSKLCRHLLLQGYKPSQITILSAYTGQMFALRKKMPNSDFEGVRVTVIDNYQGEENDIILLSLVRSNDTGMIGFLKTANRVCVALSRAKKGLYCIGNFDLLSENNELWMDLVTMLKEKKLVGRVLPLVCQAHNEGFTIERCCDFLHKSPEGGCLKECLFHLKCGHICNRICHGDDRSHDNYVCKEPCPKILCDLNHPCPDLCYLKCEPCQVIVHRILNCGHESDLRCFVETNTYKCLEMVERDLLKCCHRGTMQCHERVDQFECLVPVSRFLSCGHTEEIPCYVNPLTYKCKVIVERDLPSCDHKGTMFCSNPVEKFHCPVILTKTLSCGHKLDLECNVDVATATCPIVCDARQDCGHTCDKPCHTKDGEEHEDEICEKNCEKTCENNHECPLKCFEECHPCQVIVEKVLPCLHKEKLTCSVDPSRAKCQVIVKKKLSCSHRVHMKCCENPGSVKCQMPCKKILPCSHACRKTCYEFCGDCKVMEDKMNPFCGHTYPMPCYLRPTNSSCRYPCKRLLPCGHKCYKECGDDCDEKQCAVAVEENLFCGHKSNIPCSTRNIGPFPKLLYCNAPCDKQLECGHKCKGSCGTCRQGRMHVSCQEKCGRPQICGHTCDIPCAATCPPCNKQCGTRCVHSRCPRKCGEPCPPCKERCTWQCPHHKCTNKCGEICNREPCEEPCMKILKCRHLCVGLCGEPCPTKCRVCDERELTEVFFGNEDEEDARFVLLPDCGHVLEVEGMDHWMTQQHGGEIVMKSCPKCKTPIRRCTRYNNVIKQSTQDVADVTRKIFDGESGNDDRVTELKQKIITLQRSFSEVDDDLRKLTKVMTNRKIISAHMMALLENKVTFLTEIGNLKARIAKTLKNTIYEKRITTDIDHIKERVIKPAIKISPEEARQISFELERMEFFLHYYVIRDKYEKGKLLKETAKPAYEVIKKFLTGLKPLTNENEPDIKKAFKTLQEKQGIGIISEVERREIVAAMGLSKGHWYKCPNGHIYAIDECGGAMEMRRCLCGATIGGDNHRLLADNEHAGEMDESTTPAWPPGR